MLRTTLLTLIILSAPALAHDDHRHDQDEHEHVAEAAGIRAVHAWVNATAASEAMVYLDLENTSDEPVTLTSASTDIASSARIVGLSNSGGKLRFEPIQQMPIAPGTRMTFAPNELAIQLKGLTQRLEEHDTFPVTLNLAGPQLEIVVEVHSATAIQHSHMGHQH
ncbi:copper chaperone PCu(A)C [Paracoccus saliphilus]|uniref:Copper chaperone PCu(A)C n=1 Tax=Paracoccus saliphilus TaxID=405559 RepID=A0AA46A7F7_9RHOB|nr:copper chaperone PCu(A)C [Paracoccus saliphilus]WCR04807.1 copper chaperone PCu(A)C [Paracoccus saliphilus]SIT12843.1 hypothetical protein SAMN05421772_12217 [Paracoccus saliphilus]